jgi:hypothetical protein
MATRTFNSDRVASTSSGWWIVHAYEFMLFLTRLLLFSSVCCQQCHIWVSEPCIHFLAYCWAVGVYVYVSYYISAFWQLQITAWSLEWNLDVCRTASVLEYVFRRHLAIIPSQSTHSRRVLQNASSVIRFQSNLMHQECRQHHSGSLRNMSTDVIKGI